MGNFQVQPMPHCWKLSAPAGMMTCRKGEWKESKGTGTVWHLKHYIIVPSRVWSCSRKLAVASWSYSCFSKGKGRPESNTVIFHSEPPPKLPGHFEAVLEADGHGLKSCQVSRQSVFSISKSIKIPSFSRLKNP